MNRVFESLSTSFNTAIDVFIKMPWYAQLGIAIFTTILIVRIFLEIHKKLWW